MSISMHVLHEKKARLANLLFLVHPVGFEPTTTWFEAKYSNPLSYGCVMVPVYHI